MSQMGDVIEQCLSRPRMMNNKSLMKVVFKLYFDPDIQSAKSGITTSPPSLKDYRKGDERGKAGLRRLIDVIDRVRLTYDVDNMEPDEILQICGEEFFNSRYLS